MHRAITRPSLLLVCFRVPELNPPPPPKSRLELPLCPPPLRLSTSPPPSLPRLLPKLTVTTSKQGSEEGAENQRVLLAGLPFVYPRISLRAEAGVPLCPARFPILGEYKECFSGEEFADWLLGNVPEFQEDPDTTLVATRDLTEREDLLRRLGESGWHFDNAADIFYRFVPKVPSVIDPTAYN